MRCSELLEGEVGKWSNGQRVGARSVCVVRLDSAQVLCEDGKSVVELVQSRILLAMVRKEAEERFFVGRRL